MFINLETLFLPIVQINYRCISQYSNFFFPDMPKVESVAVWIVLKRRTHLPDVNGKPDISSLKMIMLKNRLDAWKKEVRILGYTPIVYLNYWEK